MELSPALWMRKNRFINEKGDVLTFKNHLFLFDIYKDMSQLQAIKKCAQIGASVMMNLKSFYMAKYMRLTTIYTMPSDSDVFEFVRTKSDKIFQSNPQLRKELVIDNVSLKQIGDRFIYFKGTRSKTAPLSTTSDVLIHDEIDRSDLFIIEQYKSRILASKFKAIWQLSNPSTIGVGVDVPWRESDQKEWFVKCGGCKNEQYLVWEENVDEIRRIYVCKFCNKELTPKERRLGHWKATKPGAEISGYHISQMMAPWMTAAELVKEKEKRGLAYFYNFILGEPYHVGTVADFRQMLTDSYTANPLDKEPFIMGIDIGIEKHYVLGSKKGIFKIGKVRTRQELESIIDKYNPWIAMDAGPERTWAEEFKQKYPKCFLVFYRADKPKAPIVQFGGMKGGKEDKKNWGYVWADRNRAIDKVINEYMIGNILMYLSREDLEAFIKHWETLRRIEEITGLGTKRYKWESTTGEDHWAHATVYYWIIRQMASDTKFVSDKKISPNMVERTATGFRMKSLKEMMEDRNL